MRRIALLGLLALLTGCNLFSSPIVGAGGFVSDTHWVNRNPNRPVGNSENMLRATGREINVAPLESEPGNVWPGPQPQDPTLEDLERQQNNGGAPPATMGGPATATPSMAPGVQPQLPQRQPRPVTGGSSSPPTADQAVTSPPPAQGPAPAPRFAPAPAPRSYTTPQGPVQGNAGGNGITTYQAPGGGVGIVVPNGNGTSTLVGPDGSVSTVPNPR